MARQRDARLGAKPKHKRDPKSNEWWPDLLWPNPFLDDWLEQEVRFYDLPAPYSRNGVEVELVMPEGRLDDYLNVNFRTGGIQVPLLRVDGKVWMSITYMEVQSLYVPLAVAEGSVATAGLGLGYFPLRAAAKSSVESIDVYEIDSRVIDFFVETFSGRPGFEKLNFIAGDVRELLVDKEYDYVFMDPYQTLLPDKVIEDTRWFLEKNWIGEYRFWGEEIVLLDALFEGGPYVDLTPLERRFFNVWRQTPFWQDPLESGKERLADFYRPLTQYDFRSEVLEALGRV